MPKIHIYTKKLSFRPERKYICQKYEFVNHPWLNELSISVHPHIYTKTIYGSFKMSVKGNWDEQNEKLRELKFVFNDFLKKLYNINLCDQIHVTPPKIALSLPREKMNEFMGLFFEKEEYNECISEDDKNELNEILEIDFIKKSMLNISIEQNKELYWQYGGESSSSSSSSLPESTEKVEFPKEFLCPISSTLMSNPVVTPDGITYEKSAIEVYLRNNPYEPSTRNKCTVSHLKPNLIVKRMIENWLVKKFDYMKDSEPLEEFLCPIYITVMSNPVVTPDGITYEKSAIETWLINSEYEPSTRNKCTITDLRPNLIVKKMTENWLKANPDYNEDTKEVLAKPA